MKKFLLWIAIGGALLYSTSACSDDNLLGDFSIKSEVTLPDSLVSIKKFRNYAVKITCSKDTVFQHEYTVKNEESGETETRYYGSKFTSHYYEAEPIYLYWALDTLKLDVKSNARFNVTTQVSSGAPWLTVVSGANSSGDATVKLRAPQKTGTMRTSTSTITILSQDSTVMYKIPVRQYGQNDYQ